MTERQLITGRIFEVQRFSVHDGPGIRTTVFLKGCPLRCLWCHNVEGADPDPELSFVAGSCIGCGYCFRVCPRGAHQMVEGVHTLDRDLCEACGLCAEECYAGALELVGRERRVADVLAEVLRDAPFYAASGGGMTLSGGEPTYQIRFSEALLRAAKAEGLHCCVETCGYADADRLDRIAPLTDLFLYDVKETDPARHREYTGIDLAPILDNLRRLHDSGASILLRCPIIPGLNDRDDHFDAVAALARELPRLEGVELMPYHRLGESKLERFGKTHLPRPEAEQPSEDEVGRWCAKMLERGVRVVNLGEEPAGRGAGD